MSERENRKAFTKQYKIISFTKLKNWRGLASLQVQLGVLDQDKEKREREKGKGFNEDIHLDIDWYRRLIMSKIVCLKLEIW